MEISNPNLAKSARAVEYIDNFAEGKDPHTQTKWVSWYDTKKSNGEVLVLLELCGMPLLPGPLWLEVLAPDKGSIYGLTRTVLELNCVLKLKWLAQNRTVLISKMCTHAKLNYLK